MKCGEASVEGADAAGSGQGESQSDLQRSPNKSEEEEEEEEVDEEVEKEGSVLKSSKEFVTSRGVHFASVGSTRAPHGLVSLREVLKFLVTIINPRDRGNSRRLIGIGLELLTVALEGCGRDVTRFPTIMSIIKDQLCRHLISVGVASVTTIHLSSSSTAGSP